MLNLITGAAGTGKSYEMMRRISEAVSAGKRVCAVVPDQFNFEYNRMLYKFMGMESFNRMEVLSFSRLARYIFTEYGGLKGKYADDTVRSVIMFRTLSALNGEKALAFYGKQARRPQFINDALEFVKTFSLNNISPEALAEKSGFLSGGIKEKISDVSLIYSEYVRLLGEQGFKDNCTDISEAAKKADVFRFFEGMSFFIDEFKSFTPDEYEMLKLIIRDGESLTVCLTTGDAQPEPFSVFETVNNTAAKLSQYARDCGSEQKRTVLDVNRRFKAAELEFVSRNEMRPAGEKFSGECRAVRIYEAAEPYAEADFVCAEINRLVSEEKYRYSDITVVSRCKESCSPIFEAAFVRGGIPFYSDEKQKISHKALIIFIISALKIISSERFSTEDMLRYIKTGYTGLDTEQTGILEEYCYKWNVEGRMWLEPFEIWDKASSGGESPTRDEIAENARAAVIAPLERLRRRCAGASAREICAAADEFLEEVKVRDRISGLVSSYAEGDAEVLASVRETKQLWEALCELLQSLYRTMGDVEISAADFAALFETAAASVTLSAPPQTLDEVRFSSAHTARFANPKAVFVIGANEGVLPFAAKSSPLLSDKDIEALKKGGIEISGSSAEKLAEERYVAYASLSAASERLYITYPAADVSGNVLYPALAVKQISAAFENDIMLNAEKLGLLYFCTTERNGYYQYVQSFRRRDGSVASLRKALEEFNPANKERFEFLDNAGYKNPHRLSGKDGIPELLFGRNITLSASRFEDYRKCPFMYFCKKGLRIFPWEQVSLNAPAKGNAVHYCLCEFLKEYDKTAFAGLSSEQLSAAVKSKLEEYYSSRIGGSYGKTGRFRAAFDRLAETVSDILLNLQAEFAQSEFSPDRFEYSINFDGDEKPVRIEAGGSSVNFIGAVDRIDICDENGITYVRVVDYKTGLKSLSAGDLFYGVNMQMLLYLFALTDPNAPVNSGLYHAALPAGVLYMPARDTVPSLPRGADEADTEAARKSGRKMDGMVLADPGIVKAMEKEAGGIFIPVKIKKDGDFYSASKVVTEAQFDNLRKYSAKLLKETASDIKSGRIEANPLVNGKNSPCTNCDYSSVCGNFPNIVTRPYDPEADEKMRKIMDGEEESL